MISELLNSTQQKIKFKNDYWNTDSDVKNTRKNIYIYYITILQHITMQIYTSVYIRIIAEQTQFTIS